MEMAPVFSLRQPVAELQRNQRGENGHKHIKAHFAAALVLHIYLISLHPPQTNDSTNQVGRNTPV